MVGRVVFVDETILSRENFGKRDKIAAVKNLVVVTAQQASRSNGSHVRSPIQP